MFFTFHLTNQNKQYCSGAPPYGHLGNGHLIITTTFFGCPAKMTVHFLVKRKAAKGTRIIIDFTKNSGGVI